MDRAVKPPTACWSRACGWLRWGRSSIILNAWRTLRPGAPLPWIHPEQVPDGYEVVVRSHGVPQCVYDALGARGLVVHDATCPFVAKIHRLARRAGEGAGPCWSQATKTIPRCRASLDTHGAVYLFFADLEELKALLTLRKYQKWDFCGSSNHF